eukprot:431923-Amphidinium_carterae.1
MPRVPTCQTGLKTFQCRPTSISGYRQKTFGSSVGIACGHHGRLGSLATLTKQELERQSTKSSGLLVERSPSQ